MYKYYEIYVNFNSLNISEIQSTSFLNFSKEQKCFPPNTLK